MKKRALAAAFSGLMALASAANLHAVPMTFDSRATFDAALAGFTTSTVDFESTAAGTTVSDGTAFGDVRLTYIRDPILSFGLDMVVTDQFTTTSGSKYLGVDDGGSELFLNADGLLMEFSVAVNAVGLFIITPENAAFPGDFTLTAGLASVTSTVPDFQIATGDPFAPFDDVYFLGIFDPDSTFLDATLSSIDPNIGFVSFHIDDIVTARRRQNGTVPEPGALPLIGLAAILGFGKLHQRRRRRRPAADVVSDRTLE